MEAARAVAELCRRHRLTNQPTPRRPSATPHPPTWPRSRNSCVLLLGCLVDVTVEPPLLAAGPDAAAAATAEGDGFRGGCCGCCGCLPAASAAAAAASGTFSLLQGQAASAQGVYECRWEAGIQAARQAAAQHSRLAQHRLQHTSAAAQRSRAWPLRPYACCHLPQVLHMHQGVAPWRLQQLQKAA